MAAVGRTIDVAEPNAEVVLTLAQLPRTPEVISRNGCQIASCEQGGTVHAVALIEPSPGTEFAIHGRDVGLSFPKGQQSRAKWLYFSGAKDQWQSFVELVQRSGPPEPLATLKTPGPRLWGDPLVTKGQLASNIGEAPYGIDTITVPYENPHKALFFITGLDFFSDGDAALCTAHGDVWLVSGLDESLEQVTWQRFATGLYQPLGIEIVDGKVIVLGRDQLTRLHDRNQDGEADFYESFNHDLRITGQDHAFAMRLETDSEGNFYFLKSGGGPHGSALLKVSPDGSKLDVMARGFRHPYGMGIGPGDEITVADNEGNWVPSSKIDLIRAGGFYGYLGNRKKAPAGLTPERPLCYIPKVADNSCGGQVWVTSDRWGDYHRGEMLHLSWGRCTLHAVLREKVQQTWQAATVQFPDLTFLAGPGEGAFHPIDGQLYVVGLDGWQTGAAVDGSFQRVRFTGAPIYMPAAFHVHENGIRIRFTQPLDAESTVQTSNYRVEQWNYKWLSTYGSFHYSVRNPGTIGHDSLTVESAHVLPDGKTVFLAIPGLQPVDQLHVHTDIRSADGTSLQFDLYSTVNALGPPVEAP